MDRQATRQNSAAPSHLVSFVDEVLRTFQERFRRLAVPERHGKVQSRLACHARLPRIRAVVQEQAHCPFPPADRGVVQQTGDGPTGKASYAKVGCGCEA